MLPFLENVTRGRGVPRNRLEAVGAHYQHFGGVSPINEQNRDLLAALRGELDLRRIKLPVFWGNRNWDPLLSHAVQEMREQGARRALAFFTSAYSSYSSCRQYRENIAEALRSTSNAATDGLAIERIGPYYNHPGFIAPFVDVTAAAIAQLPANERVHVLFTTHSIPLEMAQTSGEIGGAYVEQHREVSTLIASGVENLTSRQVPWSLVYQSRSGPPTVPWLEPDIEDHIKHLALGGTTAVVVVPIGFTSDHMEVMWDLDTQAAMRAKEHGVTFLRVATPGRDPRFVSMIVDLVEERQKGIPVADRQRWGTLGAAPDRCAVDCCRNLREALPAVGGDETDDDG